MEVEGELALDMSGVSKRYGPTLVLDDVTFRVRHGSIHGLVGHNGAGKSTLMKIALGGVQPTTGSVSIGGKTLTFTRPAEARDAGVGMVLQELSLIPTLSVADNIFLNDERTGLLRTIRADSQRRAARDLLAELGLTSIPPSRVVADLSIAEQQMVEIAKALRLTRRLLILDEPTAPLSFREVQRLFQLVRRTAELGVGDRLHHPSPARDLRHLRRDDRPAWRQGRPLHASRGHVARSGRAGDRGPELAAVERRRATPPRGDDRAAARARRPRPQRRGQAARPLVPRPPGRDRRGRRARRERPLGAAEDPLRRPAPDCGHPRGATPAPTRRRAPRRRSPRASTSSPRTGLSAASSRSHDRAERHPLDPGRVSPARSTGPPQPGPPPRR